MIAIFISLLLIVLIYFGWSNYNKLALPKWIPATGEFPSEWKSLLLEHVQFYRLLNEFDQQKFELQVQEFLLNCKVTGVKTEITTLNKLLVASSAVIPVFGFDEWKYTNIREVLIYPNMFNDEFEISGRERKILGMVGNKNMEGIMIISKKALELGFNNHTDKKNTAIHEFIHLIDKGDGKVDGIPRSLLENQYVIPWINLLHTKMEKMDAGKSDINPYGGTNKAEFFAVISEYFFERPKLLQKKHPQLYDHLEKIFNQQLVKKI